MHPLEISNIYKKFGSREILHGVSLELEEGEIFGLIGLNGAGKTTIIKSLLDLHRPEKGEIKIFGTSFTDASSRRNIYYLPEKFMPPLSLTGEEFLSLTLKAYGIKYCADTASQSAVGIALAPTSLKQKIKSYSKGMGQKLGLMAAFMAGRKLLVLDEPMSGLDPEARRLLRDSMQSYRKTGSIFFSSHILSDIEVLCDRIGVIHDGHMLFVGTTAELMQRHTAANLEDAFLSEISGYKILANQAA